MVLYNMYAMGRDCTIWGDDAASFRPERWLEMDSVPDNYTFPVFNAGPRECLGRRLAMVEMKTCLAMLLPEISFELAIPASEITPDTQLTLGMARGLPCYVQSVREAGDKTFASNASTGTAAPSEGQTSTASEWTVTPFEDTIESDDEAPQQRGRQRSHRQRARSKKWETEIQAHRSPDASE